MGVHRPRAPGQGTGRARPAHVGEAGSSSTCGVTIDPAAKYAVMARPFLNRPQPVGAVLGWARLDDWHADDGMCTLWSAHGQWHWHHAYLQLEPCCSGECRTVRDVRDVPHESGDRTRSAQDGRRACRAAGNVGRYL